MSFARCFLLAGGLLLAAVASQVRAADDFQMVTSRGTGATRGIVLSKAAALLR